MHAQRKSVLIVLLLAGFLAIVAAASAAPHKSHSVVLGAAKKVPYTKAGDPAGAAVGDTELKVRALIWRLGGRYRLNRKDLPGEEEQDFSTFFTALKQA